MIIAIILFSLFSQYTLIMRCCERTNFEQFFEQLFDFKYFSFKIYYSLGYCNIRIFLSKWRQEFVLNKKSEAHGAINNYLVI